MGVAGCRRQAMEQPRADGFAEGASDGSRCKARRWRERCQISGGLTGGLTSFELSSPKRHSLGTWHVVPSIFRCPSVQAIHPTPSSTFHALFNQAFCQAPAEVNACYMEQRNEPLPPLTEVTRLSVFAAFSAEHGSEDDRRKPRQLANSTCSSKGDTAFDLATFVLSIHVARRGQQRQDTVHVTLASRLATMAELS